MVSNRQLRPAPFQVALGEKPGLDVCLDLNLTVNLSLEDIRVSILPLVMEAGNIPAGSITTRVLRSAEDGSFIEHPKHKISFQRLRYDMIKALEA